MGSSGNYRNFTNAWMCHEKVTANKTPEHGNFYPNIILFLLSIMYSVMHTYTQY